MDSSNFHHTLKIFVILIGLCYGSGVLPDLVDGALGGRVTFTTNLQPTDTPFILVTWTVNSTTAILLSTPTGPNTPFPGYEDRVDLDRSTGSLELSGLTLLDSGDYTVAITTATAEVLQGLATLTVYEKVSGATINASSLPILAGSSVNLTCDAAGFVSLRRWTKDGRPRPVDDDSRVLSLSPVQRTDGGRYLCRISNPVSSQDATYNVIVNFGPENVNIDGPRDIEVARTLTLSCSAESTPAASYRWVFNGTVLLEHSQELTVENVQYSDGGNYTCAASNSVTGLNTSGFHTLIVRAQGSGLTQGLTGGAIAGIVIGLLLVVGGGAGVGVYFGQKKGLLKKESSSGSVGNMTGRDRGHSNGGGAEIQDVQYAEINHLPRGSGPGSGPGGGQAAQQGPAAACSEYAGVRVNSAAGQTSAAEPPEDVQSLYAQVKRPAPQPR